MLRSPSILEKVLPTSWRYIQPQEYPPCTTTSSEPIYPLATEDARTPLSLPHSHPMSASLMAPIKPLVERAGYWLFPTYMRYWLLLRMTTPPMYSCPLDRFFTYP